MQCIGLYADCDYPLDYIKQTLKQWADDKHRCEHPSVFAETAVKKAVEYVKNANWCFSFNNEEVLHTFANNTVTYCIH